METIVPRWEWRTFGQEFGAAEPRFAALAARKSSEQRGNLSRWPPVPTPTSRSATSFLISSFSNAWIRTAWNSGGPCCKAPFPLSASAVASVRSALGLPEAAATSGSLSLDQLLAEIAPPGGPVHIVNVSKTRTRYHVQGCVSELTDVIANGKKVRTVAIEDADAAKVIAAVAAMGLDRYPNTSYPRGLKEVIGLSSSATPTDPPGRDRRGNQLGQVSRWRAQRRRNLDHRRRPSRSHPARRRDRADRRDRSGGDGANRRRDRRNEGRSRPGLAVDRHHRRRHDGPSNGHQQLRHSSTWSKTAAESRSRSFPERKKAASPTWRSGPGSGSAEGTPRHLRHRRRQLTVHLRPGKLRSTASSASTWGPFVIPSNSGSTRRFRPTSCKQALDAIAADLNALDGVAAARRPGRDGRRSHQHRRRHARALEV